MGSVWAAYRAPDRTVAHVAAPVTTPAPDGAAAAPTTVAPPGSAAFEVVTIDGATFSVPAGRPTALLFVSTGCGTCLEQAAQLDRAAQQYGAAIAVLAIEIDPWTNPADLRKFSRDAGGLHYALALDIGGAIQRQLHAYALDTVIILDGAGRVAYREIVPDYASELAGLHRAGLA
jgi:thiol-disulfide isomerase/thioredoxin